MSQLFIPVGIPGCGKSTWGDTFFAKRTDVVTSTDRIRESMGDVNDQSNNDLVFEQFHQHIAESLEDGYRVYADATNLTERARQTLREIARGIQAEVHLVVFSNPDQAVTRNVARERVVPQHVMNRMLDNYEKFKITLIQEAHLYNSITEIRKVG